MSPPTVAAACADSIILPLPPNAIEFCASISSIGDVPKPTTLPVPPIAEVYLVFRIVFIPPIAEDSSPLTSWPIPP